MNDLILFKKEFYILIWKLISLPWRKKQVSRIIKTEGKIKGGGYQIVFWAVEKNSQTKEDKEK